MTALLLGRQAELQPIADTLKPRLQVAKCKINNTEVIESVAQATHEEDLAQGGVNMVWRNTSAAAHGSCGFATMRLKQNQILEGQSSTTYSRLRGDIANDVGPAAASATLALSFACEMHDLRRLKKPTVSALDRSDNKQTCQCSAHRMSARDHTLVACHSLTGTGRFRMSAPLSHAVALATSMHAQPAVYAVLLGSGASTGAGIPTGWGVVRELVQRLAAVVDPNDESAVKAAWEDPESWWSVHGEGELGYSTLLQRLGPTSAARQGLLASFFEANDEEREEGLKQPSKAHHAIAELVKRGFVRVIVTTNFDRLMERALEAVGVSPQVITRPEAVNGMAPLTHSPATVIKLHGDYMDLGSRNTPDELGDYPEEWKRLLAQVFDEYGLVVAGWSADWDEALVAAMEGAPNRRYPLYWDSRSSKGDNAQRLLSRRAGIQIQSDSADDLFGELVGNIDALDKLSSPPLSTAMALARLKRYLPDPVHRIDLHDLVMRAVDDVTTHIAAQPANPKGGVSMETLQAIYEGYFDSMEQLTPLLQAGVWHDTEGAHDRLWLDVLQRLVDAGTAPLQSFNQASAAARLFPAFTALAVAGMTAIRRDREELLIRMATEVEARPRMDYDQPLPAAQLLHYNRLAEGKWVNGLPRWNKTTWLYPQSHLFLTDIWRFFKGDTLNFDDYNVVFHGLEYRLGLIQEKTDSGMFMRAISGEYVGERGWDRGGVPRAEVSFRRQLERSSSDSWQNYLGGADEVDGVLVAHREVIKRYERSG